MGCLVLSCLACECYHVITVYAVPGKLQAAMDYIRKASAFYVFIRIRIYGLDDMYLYFQ